MKETGIILPDGKGKLYEEMSKQMKAVRITRNKAYGMGQHAA